MWYVYIIRCRGGTLYTGITNDVQARFQAHQKGKGAKYTRGRGPLELVYTEICADKSEALKRELAIKALPREEKLKLIENHSPSTEVKPMKTQFLPAEAPETAAIAAQIKKDGGLVAIPTETVYGLGANGLDEAAVVKIFDAKGRPQDNPLILHISGPEQIELFCHHIPQKAYDLAEKFWPGPLTIVLPAKNSVPKRTTGGLDTVAVRCPDSDVTREIIRLSGVPLAAPSANISGKPSTTTARHVYHDHNGKIPLIVDGGPCRVGVESTIIDLTENPPRLLRPGGITPEQLTEILGQITVDKAVTAQIDKDAVVKAPGMKYRHYAPDCQVLIIAGSEEAASRYIHNHFAPGDRVLCFEEELPLYADCAPLSYGKKSQVETLSAGLFAALRELDDPSVKTVYARCPVGGGIAYAVQNRLKKAAAFCIIDAEVEA